VIDKGFQANPFGVFKVKIRRNPADWMAIQDGFGIIKSSP
jgi:hypothetical protein